MENNDTQEVVETPIEETQEEIQPIVEEEEADDTPTLEDYEKAQAKIRELEAQKEHWRKKATVTKTEPINKTLTPAQSGLSREEAILYAKGYTDEEVALANKIAAVEGINPLAAIEDSLFKARVSKRLQKEKAEKAALPASAGGNRFNAPKPLGEMSREEHEAHYRKVMGL